jgi:hypothetical protein
MDQQGRPVQVDELGRPVQAVEVDPEGRPVQPVAVDPDGRPVARRPSRVRRDAPARSYERRGAGSGAAFIAAESLARIVRLAAGVIAAIIAAGIILVVLKANPTNEVVNAVHDAARALVGPFDGMFTLDSSRATIALNWGIAAVVYLIIGALVARLIAMIGIAGARGRRPVAP